MDRTDTVADSTGRVGSGPLVPSGGAVFDRVVCGLDGSDEAFLAARQALRIAPDVPVELVHAISVVDHVYRSDYPSWIHAMRDAGGQLLDEARRQLTVPGTPTPRVAVEEGDIPDALAYVVAGNGRPLLSIGSGDGTDRRLRDSGPAPTGARLSLRIVEAAPCSVLIARRPPQPARFPQSIAVGMDGSALSVDAHDVARWIAAHTGARIEVVLALGGKGADLRALQEARPPITIDTITEDKPVKALLQAADHHDLVVVGSRGLHGLRALGSVSRRIVTGSSASVLVVRRSPHHGDTT